MPLRLGRGAAASHLHGMTSLLGCGELGQPVVCTPRTGCLCTGALVAQQAKRKGDAPLTRPLRVSAVGPRGAGSAFKGLWRKLVKTSSWQGCLVLWVPEGARIPALGRTGAARLLREWPLPVSCLRSGPSLM